MTATPARPGALDRAKIVGSGLVVMTKFCSELERWFGYSYIKSHAARHKSTGSPMSENRLGQETSPYLLQHQDNPVHWWAWGPEALAEAKRTGKPIMLSVGYAACHWCHVMAH